MFEVRSNMFKVARARSNMFNVQARARASAMTRTSCILVPKVTTMSSTLRASIAARSCGVEARARARTTAETKLVLVQPKLCVQEVGEEINIRTISFQTIPTASIKWV